ncbi:hypothetical protein [Alistipes sp.]|uniref:hypothetical protein n=1 Tax=Alistipes sp. TaxID=1872444 RepID=UPI003AF05A48
MRSISILVLILLTAACVYSLRAQSLEAFKERLLSPVASPVSLGAARVRVVEHGDAARAVEEAARSSARLRFRGYRVCIFFDNGQDARASALAAKTLFEEQFPDIRVYWVYENPYFRVTVGNCLTAEEAIILKGRVSAVFPKAFPKSEELSVSDLLN